MLSLGYEGRNEDQAPASSCWAFRCNRSSSVRAFVVRSVERNISIYMEDRLCNGNVPPLKLPSA